MTLDEQAFIAAMKANPEDEAPHKVYADWLDEHDRPEEADYHRRWTVHVGKLEVKLKEAQDRLADEQDDMCYGCYG